MQIQNPATVRDPSHRAQRTNLQVEYRPVTRAPANCFDYVPQPRDWHVQHQPASYSPFASIHNEDRYNSLSISRIDTNATSFVAFIQGRLPLAEH